MLHNQFLRILHLLFIFKVNHHDVGENHKESNVVEEQSNASEDAWNPGNESASYPEGEQPESNRSHDEVEDDVGVEEFLPLLPDAVDG